MGGARALWLFAFAPLGIIAACSELDGLTGGGDADAGDATSSTDAPPAIDGGGDTGTVFPDASTTNPTAGLGVFALEGIPIDGGALVAPIRIEPGDGGRRQLDCPRSASALVRKAGFFPDAIGPWAMRAFYEPSDPSRAKFVYPTHDFSLSLVTSDSVCDGGTPPRDLGVGVTGMKMSPTFTDDGKRVAFLALDSNMQPVRVVTASTEGALDQFEVRSVDPDAGTFLSSAPPVWIRDSEGLKIAWVESENENFVVRIALDKALVSMPPTLLDCGNIFYGIEQIGVFRGAGGKTLFAFDTQLNDIDGGAPSQRGIFVVDYKLPCSDRKPLYNDVPNSYSADFTIAPDGERMAHVGDRAVDTLIGNDRQRIWIGTVSTGTRKVCSAPPAGNYDVGPQWISSGNQIAWTRRTSQADDAVVMVADVAGDVCSNERALTSSANGVLTHTAKNGCSMGAASRRSSPFMLAIVGALVATMRIRRSSRRAERRTEA